MDKRFNPAPSVLDIIVQSESLGLQTGLEELHPDPNDWPIEPATPHRLHLEKLEGRQETGRDAQDENEEDEG